jgi:hypothetical protein
MGIAANVVPVYQSELAPASEISLNRATMRSRLERKGRERTKKEVDVPALRSILQEDGAEDRERIQTINRKTKRKYRQKEKTN